jgi:iron transport multicopper oxidase
MVFSDVTFGVHEVVVKANIVTRQVGPLLSNGSAEYLYLGCYSDGSGRQMQKQYNIVSNENGACQTTCFSAGYKFAGTEYRKLSIPSRVVRRLIEDRYRVLVWK